MQATKLTLHLLLHLEVMATFQLADPYICSQASSGTAR